MQSFLNNVHTSIVYESKLFVSYDSVREKKLPQEKSPSRFPNKHV